MNAAPIPRYVKTSAPAVLSQGFRPFFLATGAWAILGLALWLASFWGWLTVPSVFDGYSWHIHEMLFGFVAAAVAGFVLTAIPNWTGRLPLQGLPLAGLVLLWAAGRAAVAGSLAIGATPAAAIDVAFLAVLTVVAAREIVAGKNWRNLPIITALGLLLVCNILFHIDFIGELGGDAAAFGWRLAIGVVCMLIALIGGRIIPSFTGNSLAKRGQARPVAFNGFDKLSLVVTGIALAAWATGISGPVAGPVVALLLAVAAVLNAVRLGRWRGHRAAAEPLLWILHVGYAWLPLGLGLLAAADIAPTIPRSAGVHALTAGAMATMILAVATRATLGHTGRELHAGPATTLIYLLIIAAALARVGTSLWSDYGLGLAISAVLWVMAFTVFLIVYGPMLLSPDPRQKAAAGPPAPEAKPHPATPRG